MRANCTVVTLMFHDSFKPYTIRIFNLNSVYTMQAIRIIDALQMTVSCKNINAGLCFCDRVFLHHVNYNRRHLHNTYTSKTHEFSKAFYYLAHA